MRTKYFWIGFVIVLSVQSFLCFQGLGDLWIRGHNGWNGSAYHLAARNTLRWGDIFPVQYYTGRTPPTPDQYYTHHPLGMHLHDVISVAIFGDSEASERLVPALHGVLVVTALMLVIRRFYSPQLGLLAGAIYVTLPINGIYANMANHSSGFIFYGLLSLACYIRFQEEREKQCSGQPSRWGRYLAGLLLFTFMATLWDWPAYYVAFVTGIHFLIVGLLRQRRTGRLLFGKDLGLLVIYSSLVLFSFAGHFLLVRLCVGHLKELTGIIATRMDVSWERFAYTLKVVPPLMMTWPVLLLAAAGMVEMVVKIARGRFEARDTFWFACGLGGTIHFFVFRWSTIVHEYWLWTTLPFVAISCASIVLRAASFVRRYSHRVFSTFLHEGLPNTLSFAAGASVFLVLLPLMARAVDLVPRGRMVGGSMWFVEPTRPHGVEKYNSGRLELLFAEQVRKWTDRSTGVLYHVSIERTVPEPRFDITLDRELVGVRTTNIDDLHGPLRPGVSGWVFITPVAVLTPKTRAEMASRHPYWQFGDYVMVDLRRDEQDIHIYRLEERPKGIWWWFWRSAFEPRLEPVRDEKAEAALIATLREQQ